MIRSCLSLFMLGLCLVVAGESAASVCQEGRGPARFCEADKNLDDVLSSGEFFQTFKDMQPQAFGIIDTNDDEVIDLEEWAVFMGDHDMGAQKKDAAKPQAPKSVPHLIQPPQPAKP